MRTTTVRCGQFRLNGALVKPLQQVPVDGSLVVPLATLDSELRPNNDANDVLQYVFIRCKVVEPAVHSVRQNTYIYKYLQSANEGVVDLTMANTPSPMTMINITTVQYLVCTGLKLTPVLDNCNLLAQT